MFVHPAIFTKYPDLRIGILVCKNVSNAESHPEITSLLRSAETNLRSQISNPDTLKDHSVIAAWQEVHRSFGSNPNKFPPSIQALAKRVAKGGELPSINPLVDLYNVISLKHLLPIGGEDIDQSSGDIQLTFSDGTETFTALGETENDPPVAGEVIYCDDIGVICRRFNWREAARTCLTEKTKNAVLVIESIPPTMETELEAALAKLQKLVEKYCGGNVQRFLLSAEQQIVAL